MFGSAHIGREEALGEILEQFCKVGRCELIGKMDTSHSWILQEAPQFMGYGAQFYQDPLSRMPPAMTADRIRKVVLRVDESLNPQSRYSWPGDKSAGWNRDETRVKVKYSSLCHCPRKDRWYCQFTGIKLGDLDELLLVIRSPRGLDIFRHDGVYGFGNLEAVLPEQSKTLSVETAPREVPPWEWWRALQLIEEKLQANNCTKIASIPWD